MTSPNYSDPSQIPDAVNAQGIHQAASTSPTDHLQNQFNQVGGPLGSLANLVLSGIAGPLIQDAEETASTAGSTQAYVNASAKTASWMTDFGGRFPNPFEILLQAISGVGGGVLDGVFGSIASVFSGKWLQLDDATETVGDLQDRTQHLEGVIGHGSAYMPNSPGTTTSAERMPFGTTTAARIGPQVGVEWLGDGRVRLGSRGLWDASAQVEFYGGVLMPPETFMDIMVRDPQGNPFYRMKAKASTTDNVTVTNVTSFTTPAAGYTVEVLAWTGGIPVIGGSFRGIRGGIETTRLMVRKVSEETE